MKCPVCSVEMSPYSYGGQTIDVCPQCRGIWFDPTELNAAAREMIQNEDVSGQEAKDAFHVTPESMPGDELKKLCPRCSVSTEVFNYSYDSNIFLNKCPTCHGVWADRGELEYVVKYLKGNPAVNKYAESFAKKLVKERKQRLVSRLLKSRLLSGIVALVYLGAAIADGDPEFIVTMAIGLIFALACIWFSDAMGGYRGLLSLPRPAITKKTPGIFIALGGWLLLLVPLVVGIISAIIQVPHE